MTKNESFIEVKFNTPFKIKAGVSTRIGGESTGPYSSFNLGKSSGEDLDPVTKNREVYAGWFGKKPEQLVVAFQCHGNQIESVTKPGEFKDVDGFMTQTPDLPLNVSIADCFPVWFHDCLTGWIAVTHCGWRGIANGIHKIQIQKLIETGSKLENIQVVIGPGIRLCHFEVGGEVGEFFPLKFIRESETIGKFFVDLPGTIRQDLLELGIWQKNIEDMDRCTYCEPDFFYSYRRDGGVTGRMMAGIMLKNQ